MEVGQLAFQGHVVVAVAGDVSSAPCPNAMIPKGFSASGKRKDMVINT